MNKKIIFAVLVVLLAGFGYWYWQSGRVELDYGDKPTVNVPDSDNQPSIQARFANKIVYTTDTTVDTAPLKAHCQAAGGRFNECGSVCGPNAAVCAEVCAYTCEGLSATQAFAVDTSDWQLFSFPNYEYTVNYPSNWITRTDSPVIADGEAHFLPAAQDLPDQVPDVFDNRTNVSVYPKGLGTEELLGNTVNYSLDLELNVTPQSKVYVTEDGVPFAAYVRPANQPDSWTGDGFIWVRLKVDDLKATCLRDGQEIAMDECAPLTSDDRIVHDGIVDLSDWDIAIAVLNSLTFFDSADRMKDMISISRPAAGSVISSPLVIEGEARGSWFFEADFPVVLTDWDGLIVASGHAQTSDNWMTEEKIPFRGVLQFQSPYKADEPEFMKRGTLILQKDNPSGLPENDASLEIPIMFSHSDDL